MNNSKIKKLQQQQDKTKIKHTVEIKIYKIKFH